MLNLASGCQGQQREQSRMHSRWMRCQELMISLICTGMASILYVLEGFCTARVSASNCPSSHLRTNLETDMIEAKNPFRARLLSYVDARRQPILWAQPLAWRKWTHTYMLRNTPDILRYFVPKLVRQNFADWTRGRSVLVLTVDLNGAEWSRGN